MRRRCGLLLVVGLLVPLGFAAQAAGQGATLTVDDSTPNPGQVITVTGTGYNGSSTFIVGGKRLNRGETTRFAKPS